VLILPGRQKNLTLISTIAADLLRSWSQLVKRERLCPERPGMLSQVWQAAIKWLEDNPKAVLAIEVLGSVFTIIGTAWFVCRFIFHVSISSIAKIGLGARQGGQTPPEAELRALAPKLKDSLPPQRSERCRFCSGSGRQPGVEPRPCEICKGRGEIKTNRLGGDCVFCSGSGRQPGRAATRCEVCGGIGLKPWD
jgi:hypothetical protein